MKKISIVFMCLLICVGFVGCKNEKESFIFDDLGIEVKIEIDETISISHDKNAMLVSNIKDNATIGVISVDKQEDKTIDGIYDTYIIGGGEKTKTKLSDNLIFVEIINNPDSAILDENAQTTYCFIFYDEDTGALLFGRFFKNSKRDCLMDLAKSIEISKI